MICVAVSRHWCKMITPTSSKSRLTGSILAGYTLLLGLCWFLGLVYSECCGVDLDQSDVCWDLVSNWKKIIMSKLVKQTNQNKL